jgi:hypothetical protein
MAARRQGELLRGVQAADRESFSDHGHPRSVGLIASNGPVQTEGIRRRLLAGNPHATGDFQEIDSAVRDSA